MNKTNEYKQQLSQLQDQLAQCTITKEKQQKSIFSKDEMIKRLKEKVDELLETQGE